MFQAVKFDPLTEYAKFVLQIPLMNLFFPKFGVYEYGTDINSIVIHRNSEYQTELFIAPREWKTTSLASNNNFTDSNGVSHARQHRHPDVDSIEVAICGEIDFLKNGIHIAPKESISGISEDGRSLLFGTITSILHTDWHGASIGKGGGSLLSIQRWLNAVTPSSVGLNWEAQPDEFTKELANNLV